MDKWIIPKLFIVACALSIAIHIIDTQDARINDLQSQVQQLNNELTAIKHEQILNNAVTEDLSNRVGWR